MSIEALQGGWFWPYLVVIVVGFLPTEVWRVLGVFAGKASGRIRRSSTGSRSSPPALVAAVVAKLVLAPTAPLSAIPTETRAMALAAGVGAMLFARRSLVVGLLVGEGALISRARSHRGDGSCERTGPAVLPRRFLRQSAMQGLIVALVGYASSVAVVVQGLRAMGATPGQIASGLCMMGVAKGLVAIGLSCGRACRSRSPGRRRASRCWR